MKMFIAEVVDPASDKSQRGDVKIRVPGSQDKIADTDLRQAQMMFPSTNPINSKVGGPVTGIQKGSMVIGLYLDDGQIPIILGTLGSSGKWGENPTPDYTKGDTPTASKDKTNGEGERLGGGDFRLIPGADRLDPTAAKVDTKSILIYAKDEAVNPYGTTTVAVDDGELSHSIGQNDPGSA